MQLFIRHCAAIMIFSIFGNGCSNSRFFPTDTHPSAEPSSTAVPGKSTSDQIAANRRPEGWRVPMPEPKKTAKVSSARIESMSGEVVQASVKEYAPASDFIFVQEFPSSDDKNSFGSRRLKLKLITEYSVKDNVFLYSVAAVGLTEGDKATGPILVFALKDENGDG